ncbi:pyrroline-5-carboxylate reductase family protein [Arthrobacter sp. HMWF013]|uniref:pyrroline-5-carboxylate reductase family protein n=1 Tax=Arthrobacter sp. HMWF013 TaxID=2056849 RepID=UPI000D3583CD|nr:pyrroline-5-carboxylate reductase [Arthrobacter sp. HMWF013]PTT70793.1 pyrroline-5-carboxylate reductase [Arthrobacter sp. HMWF013]
MSDRIAFLGCGSMNEAILTGLLRAGMAPANCVVTVRRAHRAVELAARYPGVTAIAGEEEPSNNQQAAKGAALIILGVNPAETIDLAREIANSLGPGTVVISIAAAVTLAELQAALPKDQPVVRTLPNTPIKLGHGVISLSPGNGCSPENLKMVRRIFQGASTIVEVPEEQIDTVSAISGSGPAYVYYLAEAMAAAGVELGLAPELAGILARETVAGAGLTLTEPGANASAMLRDMARPENITACAIAVFDQEGIPATITEGARAAVGRAAAMTVEIAQQKQPPLQAIPHPLQ